MRSILMMLMFLLASPAFGAEAVVYSYDALGRMTSSSSSGAPSGSILITIALDPAGNRTNYKVQGPSLALACFFLASREKKAPSDSASVSMPFDRESCDRNWQMANAAVGLTGLVSSSGGRLISSSTTPINDLSAIDVEQAAKQVG